MAMGTISETAVMGKFENFGKEMRNFLGCEIYCPESLDSGRIYYISAAGQGKHFRKRRRVHAFMMGLRNSSGLQVESGQNKIDKRRLSNPRIASYQRNFIVKPAEYLFLLP